jgi:hypothetical protein
VARANLVHSASTLKPTRRLYPPTSVVSAARLAQLRLPTALDETSPRVAQLSRLIQVRSLQLGRCSSAGLDALLPALTRLAQLSCVCMR